MARELGTKAVRVGNFRLFRTSAPCGAKERIEAIKVTNLEGSWGVVIPMTYSSYKIIVELYRSGDEKDEGVLKVIFGNWYAVTCICDGEFHNDVLMAEDAYIKRMHPEYSEEDEEDALKRGETAEEMRELMHTEG